MRVAPLLSEAGLRRLKLGLLLHKIHLLDGRVRAKGESVERQVIFPNASKAVPCHCHR